ncbi:hypothetical protein ABZ816_32245 [Actinosynnema sp. NPDC047251]|uniref:Uncharacterized protein n=1 Tax=Saccharothrix espanaensis (strain ATCC 51144 / DSM 44229 / JCM 9112 / NBRC 15066 / NRRL 15764) TaxID=1179773 RepID=K0JVD8_SACES|nr:hypothetical protein [Saccharothrix espanaensis]CCH29946.1 hypothetical protein BN6_26330 [Saccharothrix espanaensis DSM 44229]
MIDRRRSLWWVLVCAVAFALVGMHHIAQEPAAPTAVVMSEGHELPQPHGDHDILHLCLVVLAVLIALGMFLVRRVTMTEWPRPAPRRETTPRAPPPSGSLLDSLCVLRL